MDDLISIRAAIDALEKEKPTPFVNKDGSIDPFGAGQQNQWYRDGIAIMNLPPAQPEVTEEAVKDYCRKRCLTILTNDYFHKLSPAQPEREKGKWIEIPDDIFAPIVVCSRCGQTAMVSYGEYQRTQYCPYCGVPMREGGQE